MMGERRVMQEALFYGFSLEPKYVDRLRAVRKPGESYRDVIVRLAEASEGA